MTRGDDLEHILDEAGLVEDAGRTLLLVTGSSVEAVLSLLGASAHPVSLGRWDDSGSAYAATTVPGGVLAIELSGFADPSSETLARLSSGGAAAVAAGGGEATERFACARDGVVEWEASDWDMLDIEEIAEVPIQLRGLFDTAWRSLDATDDEDDPDVDPSAVAVAMAEEFTGLRVTRADVAGLVDGDTWHPVTFS